MVLLVFRGDLLVVCTARFRSPLFIWHTFSPVLVQVYVVTVTFHTWVDELERISLKPVAVIVKKIRTGGRFLMEEKLEGDADM